MSVPGPGHRFACPSTWPRTSWARCARRGT
jgi:hypothetical protein